MMECKLRKVTISDVTALLPLMKQLGYTIAEEDLTARLALYTHSRNDIAWVAVTPDDEILGCIALHKYDLFHSNARYARIVTLIVKDTYRRQGIGTKLIRRAERHAARRNCAALELSCSVKRRAETQDFYRSEGYISDKEEGSNYFIKHLKPKIGPEV